MSADRPAKDHASSPPTERRNSLRMNQRELTTLLNGFDSPEGTGPTGNRTFSRIPFRHDALQVMVSPPGGTPTKLSMACRNISRTGLSLLHNCYMHPGTKCTVLLPHSARGHVAVNGSVARCVHRAGMVHEIGIKFNEPIEVREFVHQDVFADCYSLERVNPEDLKGNVLYVDDSDMDVRIVKHFLRGTALAVRTAGTVADALAKLEGRPDLIITDFNLPDGTGRDLISMARQRGCRTPILLMTSDTGDATRRSIATTPPDACLHKPVTQTLLHRAIAEFLLVRRKGDAGPSAGGDDAETAALVQSFIERVTQSVAELEAAMKAGNAGAARKLCLELAGTAPALGLRELGEAAQLTVDTLTRAGNIAGSVRSLRALIASCTQATGRAAA